VPLLFFSEPIFMKLILYSLTDHVVHQCFDSLTLLSHNAFLTATICVFRSVADFKARFKTIMVNADAACSVCQYFILFFDVTF